MPNGDVAVVIPAKDEAQRIRATVRAAAELPGVDLVVVVDDGSADGTAAVARDAGAVVTRHTSNRGKAAAMETGAEAVRLLDQQEDRKLARHLLFLDADLADSAAFAAPLTQPVLSGEADMTIAAFSSTVKLGGHGVVVGLSSSGTRRAIGWAPAQPLAAGFGVEPALTIDLARRGLRITEVEVPLAHRATGTDLRSQLHRARQLADVARALATRR